MEIRKEIAGVLKYFSDEALTTDEAIDSILLLFSVVGQSEQLKCEHKGRRTATELVEYCEDCKRILFHP